MRERFYRSRMRRLAIVLIVGACSGESSTTPSQTSVVVTKQCAGNGVPLVVDEVVLVGDKLRVKWHAFGGCNDHAVYACWDGTLAAGYFPVATVTLGHDDFDDVCDGVIEEMSEFSLAAVLANNATIHGVELVVAGHKVVWQP